MCYNGLLPSENKAANPSFIWHDESPMFPDPTTQFQISYDKQILVDLSHPSSFHRDILDETESPGFLHCQEIAKPISAVCMGCWRAKVKCDRQSPCSKFHCSFLIRTSARSPLSAELISTPRRLSLSFSRSAWSKVLQ